MDYSDFGNLEKGTYIPRWWLERYVGLPYADKEYSLVCMGVANMIEKAIKKERKEDVYIRFEKGAIRILTDEEAAIESPRRHELAVRKLGRNIRKTRHIDTVNLTSVEKFMHQKNSMQFQYDALSRSRKETGSLLANEVSKPPDWWFEE